MDEKKDNTEEKNDVAHIITKNTSFQKFDAKQWLSVEKDLPAYQKDVIKSLIKFGSNVSDSYIENTFTLNSCGNDIYIDLIRPKMLELSDIKLFLKNKKLKKKKEVKVKKVVKKVTKKSKVEEIILKKNRKKLVEELKIIKNAMESSNNSLSTYNSEYVEIRLVGLIFEICKRLKKCKNDKEERDKDLNYELVMGIEKSLKSVSNYKDCSTEVMNDLEELNNKFKKLLKYKNTDILIKHPKYVLRTKYDDIFPSTSIGPYKSQKDLMKKLITKNNCLIFYKAMIGSGKTTTIASICEYANKIRLENKAIASSNNEKFIDIEVIFACSLEPVRHQVGNIAYNGNIKFGVASMSSSDKIRIVNHFSTTDKDRILIISDLVSALYLLKENKKKINCNKKYILFLDEPNKCADKKDSDITRAISQIIYYAPYKTILSSATMPDKCDLPKTIKLFEDKNKDSIIEEVVSKEVKIGCEIISDNGLTLMPHSICRNIEELKKTINLLETNPFLARLYTARTLYKLESLLIKNKIKVNSLKESFDNVDNMNQMNIQKESINMLRNILETNDDDLVYNICNKEWSNNEDEEKNNLERNICDDPINLDKIFLSQSYKFSGGCLIACKNPEEFALKYARKLLNVIKKRGGLTKMINKHLLDLKKYKEQIESIENKYSGSNKESLIAEELECLNLEKPVFKIPSALQINTLKHLKMFNQSILDSGKVNKKNIRIPLDDLNLNFPSVKEEILTCLCLGIGIYTLDLPLKFRDYVLELVENGELAFLIADDSISYGANYPFDSVIIMDDLAKEHSINTFFQLCGRAGRVGFSWRCTVYIVGENIHNRLFDYLKGINNDDNCKEAENIESMIDKTICEENNIKPIEKLKKDKNISLEIIRNSSPIFMENNLSPKVFKERKLTELNSPVKLKRMNSVIHGNLKKVESKKVNWNELNKEKEIVKNKEKDLKIRTSKWKRLDLGVEEDESKPKFSDNFSNRRNNYSREGNSFSRDRNNFSRDRNNFSRDRNNFSRDRNNFNRNRNENKFVRNNDSNNFRRGSFERAKKDEFSKYESVENVEFKRGSNINKTKYISPHLRREKDNNKLNLENEKKNYSNDNKMSWRRK